MQSLQIGLLDIEEKVIYLIAVSFVIGMFFLLILPVVKWLVRLQSVKLLCYLFCSLFVLLLFFLTVLFVGSMWDSTVPLLKLLLQGIAAFGVVLFTIYGISYLLNGRRRQKSV